MSDNQKNAKSVWITGVGLLSSLGEGPQTHWEALLKGETKNLDTENFAPYPVHALETPDWANQISRRDMRQMEPWQRIGTYSAGLALEDAGVKDNEALCCEIDMIVAAGGGERDSEVDASILNDARDTDDTDAVLANRLSNDLRPTLFLAQLSNLLAGNISIVHKVTGSSRTFMGEEGSGISAIQTAHARIASGQSDIVLVGGSCNAERQDMLLYFALNNHLLSGGFSPIWARDGAGVATGSMGAFLVLESADHAKARNAKAYGELSQIAACHGPRENNMATVRMKKAIASMDLPENLAVISGASGARDITAEEHAFLGEALPYAPVRAFSSILGHGIETQFPMGVALAALSTQKRSFIPPFESAEKPSAGTPDGVLVTTVGHHRAEGFGLVKPVQDGGTQS